MDERGRLPALHRGDDEMSDEKDIEMEIVGKGNIRIPWKIVLIMLGIAASAVGVQQDAFQGILDIAGV
jgi:hypothetical protein